MEFGKFPEESNLLKDNEHHMKELSAFLDLDRIKISIKEIPQRKSRWPAFELTRAHQPGTPCVLGLPRKALGYKC
jgi:hypothetical protein